MLGVGVSVVYWMNARSHTSLTPEQYRADILAGMIEAISGKIIQADPSNKNFLLKAVPLESGQHYTILLTNKTEYTRKTVKVKPKDPISNEQEVDDYSFNVSGIWPDLEITEQSASEADLAVGQTVDVHFGKLLRPTEYSELTAAKVYIMEGDSL